jgi:hypothetical protein
VSVGDFHRRAFCACGWHAECAFGKLAHLTYRGAFIQVCPECGAPKDEMTVRTARWHEGAWRDREGVPFDPRTAPVPLAPPKPCYLCAFIVALVAVVAAALIIAATS